MQKQYTVLIVDDSDEQRKSYRLIFEAEKFLVTEAVNGLDGVKSAAEKKPDLILTGIIMPKLDGFAMIEELRKNPEFSKTPVMIMSHRGRSEDKAKAEQMGIKDFLVSGFATPKEIIWRAMVRLEGNRHKKYLISVDDNLLDAMQLIKDFSLPQKLSCGKHIEEKLVLSLEQDTEEPGKFKASFVCPSEASGTFKKADI